MNIPLKIKVMTLFPEMIRPVLGQSILKRAIDKGCLDVQVLDIREFGQNGRREVDDAPYGGGAGMVLAAAPILSLYDSIQNEGPFRTILTTPGGIPFNQELAASLGRETRPLLFICGHYEGIDGRIESILRPEPISIGDYVLTGGELPTLVMIDAVTRLIPGVLGDSRSVLDESFCGDLLEYPQYTRPQELRGLKVPPVLLSGNHEEIRKWRLKESIRRTIENRPDLIAQKYLNSEEAAILDELRQEEKKFNV